MDWVGWDGIGREYTNRHHPARRLFQLQTHTTYYATYSNMQNERKHRN